jgi:KUP system potassium uptake protein
LEDGFDRANRKNLRHFIQENQQPAESSDSLPIQKPHEDGNADVVTSVGGNNVTEKDDAEVNPTVVLDTDADTLNRNRGLSYVSQVKYQLDGHGQGNQVLEEKRALQRISTCAIFHKFTHGPGVPHTFVAFIRQWPALPRVVVSMMTCAVYNGLLIFIIDILVCLRGSSSLYFRRRPICNQKGQIT